MLRLRNDQLERIRDQFFEEHIPDSRTRSQTDPNSGCLGSGLREEEAIDERRSFIDATFATAKGGAKPHVF